MKRLQTKFHPDTMGHSKVIRSKFSCSEFFLVIDILLKLQ